MAKERKDYIFDVSGDIEIPERRIANTIKESSHSMPKKGEWKLIVAIVDPETFHLFIKKLT